MLTGIAFQAKHAPYAGMGPRIFLGRAEQGLPGAHGSSAANVPLRRFGPGSILRIAAGCFVGRLVLIVVLRLHARPLPPIFAAAEQRRQ